MNIAIESEKERRGPGGNHRKNTMQLLIADVKIHKHIRLVAPYQQKQHVVKFYSLQPYKDIL
jgi:hypothetical protein